MTAKTLTIFAGPSSDEPCAVIFAVTGGEPAGITASGRGPRPARNGRIDAPAWLDWARRKIGGGFDWGNADLAAVAPGSWSDASHGVSITVSRRG